MEGHGDGRYVRAAVIGAPAVDVQPGDGDREHAEHPRGASRTKCERRWAVTRDHHGPTPLSSADTCCDSATTCAVAAFYGLICSSCFQGF